MCVAIHTRVAPHLPLQAEVLHGAVAALHPAAVIAVVPAVPEVPAGRLPAILNRVRLTVVAAAHPTRFRVLQVAGVNSVSCSA